MIRIIRNKNFQVTFENGVTVSVFIGAGSYSSNHNRDFLTEQVAEKTESSDAELAAWNKEGSWITTDLVPDAETDVIGYLSPAQVLDFMNKAANYKEGISYNEVSDKEGNSIEGQVQTQAGVEEEK